ncbi:MAG TPA: branched-chain-amino-acid transaminase [Candidatus Polarisedimenticolaceae bacterium]|nr:branched-chain-amino-acid transaminase [Candidatus Polarisedimenticolaceae bacterium]
MNEKPLPDWSRLGFALTETDWIYVAHATGRQSPSWDEGQFRPFAPIEVSPAAAFLSYGQGVFEGLKARRVEDGRIVLFRPESNAARFRRSAVRLGLPAFPEERFVATVAELTRRNSRWVPPAGSGSFYLRPVLLASEPRLGLGLCERFTTVFYGSPVGPYFSGGESRGLKLRVLEQGRVAPGGTGAAKAMGNYAGTLPLAAEWKQRGFDDVLFLDAKGAGLVSETVGSNVFAVLDSGTLVTPPLDDQILPGVTRDSVLRIAREICGLNVEERPLPIDELLDRAAEMFCTGTAYRLQPVGELSHRDRVKRFAATATRDALLRVLEGIQQGQRDDPFDWVRTIGTEERRR